MNKKIIKVVMVAVLLLSQINYLNAQEEEGVGRFENGNSYLEASKEYRLGYVIGLMDMALDLIHYCNYDRYQLLAKIIERMPAGQIMKIFEKYLEEHPDKLHYNAASLFLDALLFLMEKY